MEKNRRMLRTVLSLWTKLLAAALLTLCLLTSTVYAAAPATGGKGQAAELNADSAAAFLDEFFASEAA